MPPPGFGAPPVITPTMLNISHPLLAPFHGNITATRSTPSREPLPHGSHCAPSSPLPTCSRTPPHWNPSRGCSRLQRPTLHATALPTLSTSIHPPGSISLRSNLPDTTHNRTPQHTPPTLNTHPPLASPTPATSCASVSGSAPAHIPPYQTTPTHICGPRPPSSARPFASLIHAPQPPRMVYKEKDFVFRTYPPARLSDVYRKYVGLPNLLKTHFLDFSSDFLCFIYHKLYICKTIAKKLIFEP